MPFVEGRHDGWQAITDIAIIDAAKYKEHRESRNDVLAGVRPFRALIDTGATTTMITTRVVDELGLEFVNRKPFRNADGLRWRPAYLFYVAFYGATVSMGDSEEDGTPYMRKIYIWPRDINGGQIANEESFDVLLGMDIISTGLLVFRKDGTYRFSF
jgi:hypothetical protein